MHKLEWCEQAPELRVGCDHSICIPEEPRATFSEGVYGRDGLLEWRWLFKAPLSKIQEEFEIHRAA